MRFTRASFSIVFGLATISFPGIPDAQAQGVNEGAADPADQEQRKQARQRMLDRWKEMRAVIRVADKEQEVDGQKAPVFTYSEPTRETGGGGMLFVWEFTGRPVALLAQSYANERPIWGFELVALDERVSVVMHDGWRWSPMSAVTMKPFGDAPSPAESTARRLSQMRSLVEQFSVSEEYNNQSFELRLLPSPIYRYQAEEEGLIDGALFLFAHGTNPEALAVIECGKGASEKSWRYGFLPLAGAAVTAKLDGKTIWSKEPTRESRSQELYSTWLETDEK